MPREENAAEDYLEKKISDFVHSGRFPPMVANTYLATVYRALNKGKTTQLDAAFDRYAPASFSSVTRPIDEADVERVKSRGQRTFIQSDGTLEYEATMHKVLGNYFGSPEMQASYARLDQYLTERETTASIQRGGRRTPPEETRLGPGGHAARAARGAESSD